MTTITVSFADLQKLIRRKLPADIEKIDEALQYGKSQVDALEKDELTIEIEDSNRPDLWSVEGLAREIRGGFGTEKGLAVYEVKKSNLKIEVDSKLKTIRPFIACAIVKNVKLDDYIIKQLMQQQDKIDTSYGRKRARTSIGLYDFDLLKFPLYYGTTNPNENAFVPLTFANKLNPAQILEQHPKGKEYGHLINKNKVYPIFMDADGKVLSMPPVINSDDLGHVNENTKNLMIEVTGTNYEAVQNVLRIMAISLAERGGELYEVKIDYTYREKDITPNFTPKPFKLSIDFINQRLGTKFRSDEIAKILEKARYGIKKISRESVEIDIPSYRTDIMHAADIAEDVAIFYGYSNIESLPLEVHTIGGLSQINQITNKFRNLCVGLGAQEIYSFTLTNKENSFKKMNLPDGKIIELENPVNLNFTCVRNWIIPSLMDFLSVNTKKEYPQIIFEAGDVSEGLETKRKLAFAIAKSDTNFTEAKQALEFIYKSLDKKLEFKAVEHASFIPGRAANVLLDGKVIGVVGEIHPQVLINWGLDTPVSAFEIQLS